ncbi:MAG: hypothetical protein M0Z85_00850, partial [Gammaproteobacteria bacterium]|nr:hypothetical protein [Gammaproteobacteria bacterium]
MTDNGVTSHRVRQILRDQEVILGSVERASAEGAHLFEGWVFANRGALPVSLPARGRGWEVERDPRRLTVGAPTPARSGAGGEPVALRAAHDLTRVGQCRHIPDDDADQIGDELLPPSLDSYGVSFVLIAGRMAGRRGETSTAPHLGRFPPGQ